MEGIQEPTINDAVAHIELVRAKIHAAGNVDTENDDLNSLSKKVTKGEVPPSEAIQTANAIESYRIER